MVYNIMGGMNSLGVINNIYRSGWSVNQAIERISSGLRINQAGDDPSGLVASERLRSQMSGIEKAIQNTGVAYNLMSVAEGSLAEMNSLLKKMGAAAVTASGNSDLGAKAAAQAEFDNAYFELERIVGSSQFGSKFLLNGAQDIMFSRQASGGGTQNNLLLDLGRSTVSHLYQRGSYRLAVDFNGRVGGTATGNLGDARMTYQASKPYLEIDPTLNGAAFDSNGTLSNPQDFIVQTNRGSRAVSFGAGASVTDIVSQLSLHGADLGLGVSLTFNRSQGITLTTDANTSMAVSTPSTTPTAVGMYDNYRQGSSGWETIASNVSGINGVVFGK
ncbi:MAG: flagellin, partial [Planctomycetota bacterium]|nr:flagellin [Planctomycetota bacterium]